MTAKLKKLPVPPPNHPEASAAPDADGIPPFLDRKLNGIKPDSKVIPIGRPTVAIARPLTPEAEQIIAEQQAAKKLKREVKAEMKAAEASGATKLMPLTGKAAQQAIKTVTKREAAIDRQARKGTPTRKPSPAKARPATKPVKRGPTIGSTARAAILAGKTNEQALAAVMKAFPKCSSNLGCMSWYRGQLRKSGELK